MNRIFFLLIFIYGIIIIPGCKKEKTSSSGNSTTVLNVSMIPALAERGDKITLTIHMTNSNGLTLLKLKAYVRDSVTELPSVITVSKTLISYPSDTTYFYKYVVPQGTFIGDTLKFISIVSAKNSSDVTDTHKVVVRSAYSPIRKWTTPITLYGQNLTGNHYFASVNGNSYDDNSSASAVNVIDIFYASVGPLRYTASFISPASRNFFGFLPPISGFTKTYFGESAYDTIAFNKLVNDSLIGAIPSTLADTAVAVSSGNVYEFINSNRKKGFLKVISVVPDSVGNIVFEVKVQE